MSRVAPPTLERIVPDDRRAMTPARKRRIWEAAGRRCGICREPVEMEGPNVVYDHTGTLWITGSDADSDIAPLHKACDAKKTPGDLSRISKTKRQQTMRLDVPRPPAKMKPGRGFSKVHRPFRSKR
jgi:hypothetical protein